MTSTDQAFIKAYRQQGDVLVAAPGYAASNPAASPPRAMNQAPATRTATPMNRQIQSVAVATEGPPAVEDQFRPAFQVDHLAWAGGCTRLSLAAGLQLDRLADALVAAAERDLKVIGLINCRRNEGCTTMLLCAARRLAERGHRVVAVDADFDSPALAQRLGLLPEAGWEEVLSGRLPLEEVAIESLQDRLTIVPLIDGLSATGDPSFTFAALRRHHDLVLVDLGCFDESAADIAAGALDGLVIVHDVRSTSPAELARLRDHLADRHIVEIGVAENFV
jgi:Mrp family chromosome partitioning ATPase